MDYHQYPQHALAVFRIYDPLCNVPVAIDRELTQFLANETAQLLHGDSSNASLDVHYGMPFPHQHSSPQSNNEGG